MKKYKIVKSKNGLGKYLFFIKKRYMIFFWKYLIFTKTPRMDGSNLSEEAYMFDNLERAEGLINRIKRDGEIDTRLKTVKKM